MIAAAKEIFAFIKGFQDIDKQRVERDLVIDARNRLAQQLHSCEIAQNEYTAMLVKMANLDLERVNLDDIKRILRHGISYLTCFYGNRF